MKIGIDIDDTITDTKKSTIEYLMNYNLNLNEYSGDLNDKKTFDFLIKHIEDIQTNVSLKPGVKEAFTELKKMSYEIIIITARGGELDYDHEKVTKDYFAKHNLPYDKIYFGNYPKGDIALKEKINIFIDDRIYNLDDVSQYGIECLHFVSDMNIKSPYKKFDNWDDIILYLKNRGNI
ncbi:MAG: hypothetical protein PHS24_01905 [Bacilli bacterium]|nr:hypothetical protein [Bacilli bacterium]